MKKCRGHKSKGGNRGLINEDLNALPVVNDPNLPPTKLEQVEIHNEMIQCRNELTEAMIKIESQNKNFSSIFEKMKDFALMVSNSSGRDKLVAQIETLKCGRQNETQTLLDECLKEKASLESRIVQREQAKHKHKINAILAKLKRLNGKRKMMGVGGCTKAEYLNCLKRVGILKKEVEVAKSICGTG